MMIATRMNERFSEFTLPAAMPKSARLALNPLYQPEQEGGNRVWRLIFPSPDYASEYAACKRYLPERLELTDGQFANLKSGPWDDQMMALAACHVLLDLPARYV